MIVAPGDAVVLYGGTNMKDVYNGTYAGFFEGDKFTWLQLDTTPTNHLCGYAAFPVIRYVSVCFVVECVVCCVCVCVCVRVNVCVERMCVCVCVCVCGEMRE